MQAFVPLSVQLLTPCQTPGHDYGSPISLKVPHQHQHQAAQLGVMLLTIGRTLHIMHPLFGFEM